MGLKQFLKKLYRDVVDDAITDSAAQLSYYFLFALFPFLFFVVTVSAYFPVRGSVEGLIDRMGDVMPQQAVTLLKEHTASLFGETRPKLVTFTLLASVWTASRGVDALRKALNLAYGVAETRAWWKTQSLAVMTTVVGTLGWMVTLTVLALGGKAGRWIADHYALIDEVHLMWSWSRWPITVGLVMFSAGVMYWALPNVRLRFRVFTPGTVVGAFLWVASTWVFTEYVDQFGRFNVTYGSIGGVVVLMLWLYISGLILIFGGEINALLDAPDPDQHPLIPVGAAKSANSTHRLRQRLARVFRRSHRPPPRSGPGHPEGLPGKSEDDQEDEEEVASRP
ncbi:MAG: YihY/virulence factor BrkB family protein [Myxococcota bacterium]|nr:YihY/virulence factor BrkB family protein [Myxococcota bacterium]